MKALITGAVAFLCASAAIAYEPHEHGLRGPYVAVQAGGVYRTADEIPGIYESDPGLAVIGTAGYGFGSGLRLEGEVSWRSLDSGPILIEEDDVLNFFGNLVYELPAGWLRPYVGAGAGVARVDTFATDGLFTVEGETTSFAYQVIGGMSIRVNPSIDIITDYRYTATGDLEISGFNADADAHNITGGVRLHF